MSLSDEFRSQLIEYKRPWKLFSLFSGLALLVSGSFYYKAPDWDVPICFIMAFFAYLTNAVTTQRLKDANVEMGKAANNLSNSLQNAEIIEAMGMTASIRHKQMEYSDGVLKLCVVRKPATL